MIISPPTMMTLFFSKDPTSIFRGLNTISPLKVFVDPYFYLCGDLVTTEINGEVTHTFSARTYIKNVNENIDNLFDTTLNNYGSPLKGGYIP